MILLSGLAVAALGVALLGQPGMWPLAGIAALFMSITMPLAALVGIPAHVRAWRTGAIGEERVGRILDELVADGYRVLHDRRRPGGRDNIDHIVIGPTGVFVVETKHYAAPVRVRGGELFIGGRRKPAFVDQVRRQIDSVGSVLGVPVAGVICVVDGQFPWFGSTSVNGLEVLSPGRLAAFIRDASVVLSVDEVARLGSATERALPPR